MDDIFSIIRDEPPPTRAKEIKLRLLEIENTFIAVMRALRGKPVLDGPFGLVPEVFEAWEVRHERDVALRRLNALTRMLSAGQRPMTETDPETGKPRWHLATGIQMFHSLEELVDTWAEEHPE